MTNSATGETRTIALNLANALIAHPCQLDPESGIARCDDPGHDEDARALREALEMAGVVETVRLSSRAKTGRCPECLHVFNLTQAGLLNQHKFGRSPTGPLCQGKRQKPVSDDLTAGAA